MDTLTFLTNQGQPNSLFKALDLYAGYRNKTYEEMHEHRRQIHAKDWAIDCKYSSYSHTLIKHGLLKKSPRWMIPYETTDFGYKVWSVLKVNYDGGCKIHTIRIIPGYKWYNENKFKIVHVLCSLCGESKAPLTDPFEFCAKCKKLVDWMPADSY
jgi:hypothetical protein